MYAKADKILASHPALLRQHTVIGIQPQVFDIDTTLNFQLSIINCQLSILVIHTDWLRSSCR